MSRPTQSDELARLLSQRLEAALAATADPAERSRLVLQVVKLCERLAIRPLRRHVLGLLREGRGESLAELLEHVDGRYRTFREALKARRMRQTPAPESDLSPGEAASYLGVSPKTIAKWCDRGMLRCVVLESGHRRIPTTAIEPYKKRLAPLESLDLELAPAWRDVSEAEVVQEMLNRDRKAP